MPQQQVAFMEECRKIKGCGSLREDFYTRFIPIFKDFGAVTWLKIKNNMCKNCTLGLLKCKNYTLFWGRKCLWQYVILILNITKNTNALMK